MQFDSMNVTFGHKRVQNRTSSTLPLMAKLEVATDLPLDRANDLFHLIATTDLSKVQRVVFGPTTYATGTGGTSFVLNLKVDRAWIKSHFPPIRPMGLWPEVTPAPSATPGPSGGSSAAP